MSEELSQRDDRERVPFLRLSETTAAYGEELREAVCRVVDSGWYLNGPETKALEAELASGCGAGECIAVSNGLDALRLMIRAQMELGRLHEGDEVLVPANTYIASILPITEFGLRAVGVEPSEEDFNIDFRRLKEKLTPRTKGVMLVHLYGNPAWNSDVMGELRDSGILVMEDNAQGIGAEAHEAGFHGSRITGGLGDCAAFSFYPTKNVGAMGDAGAVCTSDSELASCIRTLANYGSDRRYHNITRGYNCRMDEIQAAILRVKLRHLEEINRERRRGAAIYDRLIENPLILKPKIFTDRGQVWHQYVVRTKERASFREYLKQEGVDTDIHYEVPPHRQPCYEGYFGEEFPLTDLLASEAVSLPIANMTPDRLQRVAEVVNAYKK